MERCLHGANTPNLQYIGCGRTSWGQVTVFCGSAMTQETTTNLSAEMAALSPAMRQYRAAKDAHPDTLLFFRMGDFYELFFEDAVVASRELQLTLTARDKARSVPMCGVPYHAAENYLQRLLRKGYRVAICEQMEDPKLAKSVVKREVTRVLTPGTAIDPSLGAEQSNYLASVALTGSGAGTVCGLALLDLSTGEFRATEFSGATAWSQIADELGRMRPVELLYGRQVVAGDGKLSLPLAGEKSRRRRECVAGWNSHEDRHWRSGSLVPTTLSHSFAITSMFIRSMASG